MTKKELKKRKQSLNYEFYVLNCDKLKNSQTLSLKTLQRVLRPCCRTTLLNDTVLSYYLKNTKIGISITMQPKPMHQTHYFTIKISTLPLLEIQLSAVNLKELMHKINHTYKFLIPTV
jgi:hypothetical protein